MSKDISAQSLQSKAVQDALDGKSKGFKRLLPFLGPAFIAAIAYIDPGNFATNISAGSKYGYMLLWVILFSNLMAFLIQVLSAKLGIATGKNLPEIARDRYPKWVSAGLWIQGELVIMATDLAEFIGAALGLNLLFGIPMVEAAIIAAIGSFAILELQRRGYRALEAGIAGLLFVVVIAFALQTFFAKPDAASVLEGLFIPKIDGMDSVLLATGILGATVMPHAIYLHSALTQRRVVGKTDSERKKIFRFETIDILIAMVIAGAINASMLIVAAALFFKNGLYVEDLDVAYQQFGHYIGPASAILFGIGLLAAGLSSSSVGTLSGDIIMQGFIRYRIPLYLRRFITIIPPMIIIISGVNATEALVWSQVVLSFGIAFALVPLIMFTSNKRLMGALTNRKWVTALAWLIAVLVIALNLFVIYDSFR
ncbi:manganese transport protein MntH [Bacillus velezensis]|nr:MULTISPECIES: Nramp family divalent metal transporter [Bacillus]AFJ60510.1 metal ion transporter, Nramp family [Bacillus velezensis YAU B9601-Y2]AJE77491.1 manganese transport protein MntH [Bacillus sp. BH072]AMQ70103.1 manganese transporter [Bacillus amyloliquefaciens UMAF6639]AMQ72929.1 manganese transporter [Bacillus amyloliquefaciens UMAF6614]ERH51386.1 manganese transporter [Bacillus amyloliquefaciens EGD-AQ14]CDH94190.1 putative manganese transport protein mntH [Bacillus velezensis N|eukprot:TRINITY_DN32217_c0_g1_i1.p1 TRINITY_DN32217_c0_g1~~TRINITY_DN32217_c0_g1_i1.p1  ORF type:complete len:425 (+),score=12.25 TRINITY_DN32217_c0_g1_i1:52-1326(+)